MKAEREKGVTKTHISESAQSVIMLAWQLAIFDGMNIGVDHIFSAIVKQATLRGRSSGIMAHSQNRVTLLRCNEDLRFIWKDSEKIEAGQEIGFTPRAKNVLERAVRHATVRGSSYQLTDVDILEGIAGYAQNIRLGFEAENAPKRKEINGYYEIVKPFASVA